MYPNNDNKPARKLIKEMPNCDWPSTRLESIGVDALSMAELLAIVINRPDGLDLANEMLSHFNGVSGLASAELGTIQQFYGIGRSTAVRIQAALALGARSVGAVGASRPRITSPADAANIIMPLICHKKQEHLLVIVLDTRNQVEVIHTLYIGSLNSSVVRVSEIFKIAIARHGAAIIMAHNHPSGDPRPSPEDIHVTRQIQKAGQLLDIELLDHVIVGRRGDERPLPYVSLKEHGLMDS